MTKFLSFLIIMGVLMIILAGAGLVVLKAITSDTSTLRIAGDGIERILATINSRPTIASTPQENAVISRPAQIKPSAPSAPSTTDIFTDGYSINQLIEIIETTVMHIQGQNQGKVLVSQLPMG